MFAKVKTACVIGINGVITDVETYIGSGLPSFEIIGKAETAVKESRERIKAVLKNCGYDVVTRKTTINLYPADTVKKGSHFDLPIAIGVLAASGQLQISDVDKLEQTVFFGELSLDGRLKPVKGILPMTECANDVGIKQVVVPADNIEEAKLIEGVKVLGFENISNVVAFLQSNDERFATDNRQIKKRQRCSRKSVWIYLMLKDMKKLRELWKLQLLEDILYC